MSKEGDFSEEISVNSSNYIQTPLISIHTQAGFLSNYENQIYMDELPKEYWEIDKEYQGNYMCFEVPGDSMDDETSKAILAGDKLLAREVQIHLWEKKLHLKWNFIIVHKEKGVIIKKITDHNVEKGIIKCHSLNPMYEDFELNLKDVIALFNVVDLKRKPLV